MRLSQSARQVKLNDERVKKVYFCDLKNPFDSYRLTKLFSLNDSEIKKTIYLLNETEKSDGIFPFVGVVGYLAFFDKDDQLLFIAHAFEKSDVICMQRGSVDNNGYIYLNSSDKDGQIKYRSSVDFAEFLKKIRNNQREIDQP